MIYTPRIQTVSVRLLLTAVSLALLSGCATRYPSGSESQLQYALDNDSAQTINNDTINGFLEQSPAGGVVSAANSPWGNNVEIVADQPYLAASGRECRRLQIIATQGENSRALACKTPQGWVNQRVVTQTVEGRLQ
ncbi:DVU3141 family protein [Vreelandella sp. EE27]